MTQFLLTDLRTYFVNETLITSEIYLAQLPDPQPGRIDENVLALVEYGGEAPVWVQPQVGDSVLPKYRRPRIQVSARGNKEDYPSAEGLAALAYTAVAAIKNRPLDSGTFYQSMSPLQEPFLQRWDQNRRPIMTFNVEVYLTRAEG